MRSFADSDERKPDSTWWVSARGVSLALSLSLQTIHKYCRQGLLVGIQLPTRHYTDERPRKTTRARWRITVDSVEALLTRLYAGQEVPRGVRRWLKRERRQ